MSYWKHKMLRSVFGLCCDLLSTHHMCQSGGSLVKWERNLCVELKEKLWGDLCRSGVASLMNSVKNCKTVQRKIIIFILFTSSTLPQSNFINITQGSLHFLQIQCDWGHIFTQHMAMPWSSLKQAVRDDCTQSYSPPGHATIVILKLVLTL